MPRSVKASRIQVSSDATPAELPTGAALSRYTWALTVPTRGLIKKIVFRLTDGSAINGTSASDSSCFYLHTTCAGGAGVDKPIAGEESSVLAQYPYTVERASTTGGARLFTASASNVYVFMVPLSTVRSSVVTTGTAQADQSDPATDVFYDLSGTTKGPVAGTGTIFVTMSGQGSSGFDFSAMSSATVILDIEPCT